MDWRQADLPKLWRYNLHYFDYLSSEVLPPSSKRSLVESWIANNPQGSEDAWEPYTISLRVVNWIKYFLGEGASQPPSHWLESLACQVRWLARRPEYHLLANHLFKNAVALVYAGGYFGGPEGEAWFHQGWNLFRRELNEQILSDGAHCERSPMYHAIGVVDCLDVYNLLAANPQLVPSSELDELRDTIRIQLAFLMDVTLPNESYALLNDSANGIAPTTSQILAYAERLGFDAPKLASPRTINRPQSGYFGYVGQEDYCLFDGGEIGPDYQPGHAHCDTLSFVLVLGGVPVVVDTGVFDYEISPQRNYCRSTQAHNTVMLDRQEQSEIWGAFRVARRAKPLQIEFRPRDDGFDFEGMHDGYLRLKGSPLHMRKAHWQSSGRLEVKDTVLGAGVHIAESFLHFHPDCTVELVESRAIVKGPSGMPVAAIQVDTSGAIALEDGQYFPEFGKALTNKVLRITVKGRLPLSFGFVIEKWPQGTPQ